MLAPLAISAGDPAGVGPVVTAAALARTLDSDRALVYGDAGWMERALRRYSFESMKRIDTQDASTLAPGEVGAQELEHHGDENRLLDGQSAGTHRGAHGVGHVVRPDGPGHVERQAGADQHRKRDVEELCHGGQRMTQSGAVSRPLAEAVPPCTGAAG